MISQSSRFGTTTPKAKALGTMPAVGILRSVCWLQSWFWFFVLTTSLRSSLVPTTLAVVFVRAWINENDQANRAISTGQLHTSLRFHIRPINVVVFHDSQGNTRFEGGFLLRCFQQLSRPNIATLQCGWRHNRSTRDSSNPVLSY